MKWTREKPTKPGHYWCGQPGFEPHIECVFVSEIGSCKGDLVAVGCGGEEEFPIYRDQGKHMGNRFERDYWSDEPIALPEGAMKEQACTHPKLVRVNSALPEIKSGWFLSVLVTMQTVEIKFCPDCGLGLPPVI